MKPTRAVIHLQHLDHNLSVARQLAPQARICAPVKANAYGHGAVEVARRLKELGVEALGVASPEEGHQLRLAGIKGPLLLFGAVNAGQISEALEADLQPFVFDAERIRAWGTLARATHKTVKVHLKVDTGMGRLGCPPEEAARLARQIVHEQGLELEGLCTHLASSDGPGPLSVPEQLERFNLARQALADEGLKPRLVHAANSGALIDWPEAHFDMVRPGIALYGYPSPAQKQPNPGFLPLLEWRSEVVFVKEVPAGTTISYGSKYVTKERTKIATIPVGYADGWRRSLTNSLIRVGDEQARVVGTICMDQFMVDLGPTSLVKEGDPVVLLDPWTDTMNAQARAGSAGTIPYEILCGISARVPREFR